MLVYLFTPLKSWNMQDSVTEHIHRDAIFTMCDFVLSETGASQSLCWRGPSGWEPAPQMSAVLQHSHSAHSSHGGPCLPQVSCSVTDRPCSECIINQDVKYHVCFFIRSTALPCHWTLRFPKALLLCLSSILKMWPSFCFLSCSKFIVFHICLIGQPRLNSKYFSRSNKMLTP